MSARDVIIKALQAQHGVDPDYDDGLDADAILAALSAAGWVVVPREPTEEMVAAGWIDKEDVNPDDIYRAMIAAALPAAPQEATDDAK